MKASPIAPMIVDVCNENCNKDSVFEPTIPYREYGTLKNAFPAWKKLCGCHDAQTFRQICFKVLDNGGTNKSSVQKVIIDSQANILSVFKNEGAMAYT